MNGQAQELIERLREGRGTVDGRRFQVSKQADGIEVYHDGRQVLDPATSEPLRLPSEQDEDFREKATEMLLRAFVLADNGDEQSESVAPPSVVSEADLTCPECGFVALDKRGLRAHERSHDKVTCPICGKEVGRLGYTSHERWHATRGETLAHDGANGTQPEPQAAAPENEDAPVEERPATRKRRRKDATAAAQTQKPRSRRRKPELTPSFFALEVHEELLGCGMDKGRAREITARILDLELARR